MEEEKNFFFCFRARFFTSLPISSDAVLQQFQSWARVHNKQYAKNEFIKRYENFVDSLARIEKKNSNATRAVFGLNKFSVCYVSK
jgi:hypothetical protein